MDINQQVITKSPEETQAFGSKIAHSLLNGEEDRRILCLYGDLGSGKTTFTQGLAKALGVNTRLLSPTFIIVRRYALMGKFHFFYHIDLYRLAQESDCMGLGLTEILSDRSSLVCIEWADKLGSLFPKTRMDIYFSSLSNGAHKITFD